ncbi:MAG: threonylcarbamoyl-AMP synthase [Victivallales bacterium]|nr:threonylcarbamoyl-AMP synthase [Victivallales bacterium]
MDNVFELNDKNISLLVRKCSAQLKVPGSFILIPTETVYGLACSWSDETAKKNIYKSKIRPEKKPLQLLISDISMLHKTNAVISGLTKGIISNFCPGPITIIVPTDNKSKIGFRLPQHEFVISLIKEFGSPLSATSANITGEPPALDAFSALKTLNKVPDITVNFGQIPKYSRASTVIEIDKSDKIYILREGPISYNDLKNCKKN